MRIDSFDSHWGPLKNKPRTLNMQGLFFKVVVWIRIHDNRWKEWASHTSLGFNREPEEVIASDLIASSFPSDVGEGGVKLVIPLVAAFQHVYSGWQYTRMQHIYPKITA